MYNKYKIYSNILQYYIINYVLKAPVCAALIIKFFIIFSFRLAKLAVCTIAVM